jgi:hypothetical protein
MMGSKARLFAPISACSLDELVPADHFYRYVEHVLDLSFVRALVRDTYAADTGRPSIDPVVFFKLQLVMFFEGIRSERQLLRLARYRGLRKTHLQEVATATAMDLSRLHHWIEGDIPTTTRRSRFARLAAA